MKFQVYSGSCTDTNGLFSDYRMSVGSKQFQFQGPTARSLHYNVYIYQSQTENSLCWFMVFIPINVSINYFSCISVSGWKQIFHIGFDEAKH